MDAPRTARARARLEITAAIKATAERHLAQQGASGLSLRAVARELEMSSSAVYRYFASRDELLTALIIDAYDSLGAAVEKAEAKVSRDDLDGRWIAAARAVRRWARRHPERYSLVYGSPVPGYRAPADTIGPATRASAVLAGIVVDGAGTEPLRPQPPPAAPLPDAVGQDMARLADEFFTGVPPAVVARAIAAWTALFGLVSFEQFGQYESVIHHREAYFDHTVAELGRWVYGPNP